MIEPRKIGRFLVCDSHGYVTPDVSHRLITAPWDAVVEYVLKSLMNSPEVKAVYIRGSIPRGLAISGTSDADFIYFSETDLKAVETSIEQEVLSRFPYTRGIELVRLNQESLDKVHAPQKRPYFQMLLKTQALHLAGDDLVGTIEPFQVGRDLVSHVFALQSEFAKLPKRIDRTERKLKHENGSLGELCVLVLKSQ